MRSTHCRRIVLALAVALCVAPALAQHGPRHGHGPFQGDGQHLQRMLDRLDLSEVQRAEVDRMVSERRQTMQARMDQMRERHLALADAMHAESFDETAIRDAMAAVAVTQADLAVERASLLHDVRRVLTPEQREQARQMLEQHRELTESGEHRFRGHHGRHGHGARDQAQQELDD